MNDTNSSALPLEKPLENSSNRMSQFVFFCHIMSTPVFILLVLSLSDTGELSIFHPFILSFLAFEILCIILRVIFCQHPILQAMLVLEFFLVMTMGYIFPVLSWLEFFFIPVILLEIVILFPFYQAIILEILLGMFGSIALSNHLLSKSMISISQLNISVSFISFCFYIPLSLCMILLTYVKKTRQFNEIRIHELENSNRRLDAINRNINLKLFSIQQDSSYKERMRISKEIHDTAGYVFINIIMLLQTALAVLDLDKDLGVEKINTALDCTRRGINEIRYILREMQAYEKPSLGLQNELYEIASLFMHATGVTVELEYGNWPRSFSSKVDVFFISFLQETLTNALKHGKASHLKMICWESDSNIMMSVKDNGKCSQSPITFGMGISGIYEFVKNMKGEVAIDPAPDGFMIRVSIPTDSIGSSSF